MGLSIVKTDDEGNVIEEINLSTGKSSGKYPGGKDQRRPLRKGADTSGIFENKENEDDKDDKFEGKNKGGAVTKKYGMREGGFTKRGGMYKKGY